MVHLNCGVAALVAAVVVGKRKGYGDQGIYTPQSDTYSSGRGTALVRLVRFQCGKPTCCGWRGR